MCLTNFQDGQYTFVVVTVIITKSWRHYA